MSIVGYGTLQTKDGKVDNGVYRDVREHSQDGLPTADNRRTSLTLTPRMTGNIWWTRIVGRPSAQPKDPKL